MSSINNDWFIVKDLNGFIDSARIIVFNHFGNQSDDSDSLSITIDETEKEELNSLLSFNESETIVLGLLKKQKHKTIKSKFRYICNEKIFMDIIISLNDRIVSNVLNNLVNKGLVDVGYDEKTNDFVFWVKKGEQ